MIWYFAVSDDSDYADSELDESQSSDGNSNVTNSDIDNTTTTSTSVNFSDTSAFLHTAVVNITQTHNSDESDTVIEFSFI